MITGINILRNCIKNGYPWVESILSALPLCSEYLVNDGGSTDGTLEALLELAEAYPKIVVYQIPDTDNVRWDSVSNQINHMIQDAKGGVIFLGNADELIHEDDIQGVKEQALYMQEDVLRFDRREVTHNWKRLSKEVYHPARLARNYNQIRQDWNAYGGDEFLYSHGWPDPDRKSRLGVTLYHLYNMFPLNRVAKLRNDAEYLSPGDAHRVAVYERMKNSAPKYKAPENILPTLPALARGLPYMAKYRIRECLYDPVWVKTVTRVEV